MYCWGGEMCVSATSEPTPTSETDMCLLLKYKTTRKVSMQIQKNVQLEVGGRTNRWFCGRRYCLRIQLCA